MHVALGKLLLVVLKDLKENTKKEEKFQIKAESIEIASHPPALCLSEKQKSVLNGVFCI